jgi:hypothetical protein
MGLVIVLTRDGWTGRATCGCLGALLLTAPLLGGMLALTLELFLLIAGRTEPVEEPAAPPPAPGPAVLTKQGLPGPPDLPPAE